MLLVFTYFDTGSILLHSVRVNALIAFRNDHGRMDVAVGALCQCHLFNELVHQGVQLRVFRYGIDSRTRL